MHSSSINRATPFGCVLGLMALFCVVFIVLGVWGLVRWFDLPKDTREVNAYFWVMLGSTTFGIVSFTLFTWLAWKSWRGMDFRDYDPDDPDGPAVKF